MKKDRINPNIDSLNLFHPFFFGEISFRKNFNSIILIKSMLKFFPYKSPS